MNLISRKFKKSDICQLGTQKKTLTFSNKKSVSLKVYKQTKTPWHKQCQEKNKQRRVNTGALR